MSDWIILFSSVIFLVYCFANINSPNVAAPFFSYSDSFSRVCAFLLMLDRESARRQLLLILYHSIIMLFLSFFLDM